MDNQRYFKDIVSLVEALSPYFNSNSLARVVDVNEGQMRQYVAGIRRPRQKTIRKINANLVLFGKELQNIRITDFYDEISG